LPFSENEQEEDVDEDREIITFYESDRDDLDTNEDWINGIH